MAVLCLGILIAISPWSPAWAAEVPDYTVFSLEDLMEMNVVYGVSKHRQQAKEAPASITIISQEDIRTYGYQTMAEVLNSLHGFFMTYDRNYHYVGLRGLGEPGDMNSRILTLVDGIRANEGSVGGVMMGNGFPVDLELIDRIEVIRGPASSLYGTNAMLGIVNVVTREGYQLNGIEAQSGFSSYGGRRLRLTGGYETSSGVDMLVSGSLGRINGQDHYFQEFAAPETNNGVFEDGDKEEWNNFLAKVLYRGLRFEALYGWRLKHSPVASSYSIFNDNSAKAQDTSWSLGLGYRRPLPWGMDLSTQILYQRFKWDGESPYGIDYEGNPLDYADPYVDDFRGRKLTGNLDVTKRLPGDHVLAVGAEYANHMQMDMSARDQHPYHRWYDFKQSPENWAVYGLSVFKIMPGLLLNLGVRHDQYTTFGGSTNPRFALITEPRSGTVFKALYGKAFRAPDGYEISSEEANEQLAYTPEAIATYELILEQELGDDLNATLSGYLYDYRLLDNGLLDDQSSLPSEEWINDETKARGIEFELARQPRAGIRGRFSYSYNRTKERLFNPRQGESRAAPHVARLNLSVPGGGIFDRVGLEVQYHSPRMTIRRHWASHYYLVNLSVWNHSLVPHLEVRGSITNLLNDAIAHPGTAREIQDLIRQDGRSFRLSVTLTR
ncbi:hypothetical protein CSB20_12550 [bacterium DOLZORAL124_64_63]|nr:MAG: hypothetical protein CSB20_12550 [bacterium DOLZORAL124_64_63]